jgi:signal transduction histidine kinase
VEVRERGAAVELPLETRRQLLLLFKEALQNINKHAAATRVTVEVAAADGRLTVSVADDGRGFDPAGAPEGHGLRGMDARARALGGRLDVTSAPGAGTTLVFTIPVP